jgi:hypothetical protein
MYVQFIVVAYEGTAYVRIMYFHTLRTGSVTAVPGSGLFKGAFPRYPSRQDFAGTHLYIDKATTWETQAASYRCRIESGNERK